MPYRITLSRDVFRFWEKSDINSKMVKNRHIVSIKVELPMTLSKIEGHFCYLKPL